jgi:hypothetical protein
VRRTSYFGNSPSKAREISRILKAFSSVATMYLPASLIAASKQDPVSKYFVDRIEHIILMA